MAVPQHVLSAFQVESSSPAQLGHAWDNGLLFGSTVISHAHSTAAWSAKVRDKISVDGLCVARPVRSTDGRFVVSGYKASAYIAGQPATRVDETIAAALRFDDAMTTISHPTAPRSDRWAKAEEQAWEDSALPTVPGPRQVGHADFLASTVYSGTLPPALTDIVPTGQPRPRGYTAALVLIDALLHDVVDPGVIQRWAHVPHLHALCQRALAYRALLSEKSDLAAQSCLQRVGAILVSDRSATI